MTAKLVKSSSLIFLITLTICYLYPVTVFCNLQFQTSETFAPTEDHQEAISISKCPSLQCSPTSGEETISGDHRLVTKSLINDPTTSITTSTPTTTVTKTITTVSSTTTIAKESITLPWPVKLVITTSIYLTLLSTLCILSIFLPSDCTDLKTYCRSTLHIPE
ncbi:hypothetical protein TYRP_009335 [Tyrophagus putrescentiae]|nr:hypothetical protein TYRP_009335 [Tyrophagus putrescentiae]